MRNRQLTSKLSRMRTSQETSCHKERQRIKALILGTVCCSSRIKNSTDVNIYKGFKTVGSHMVVVNNLVNLL